MILPVGTFNVSDYRKAIPCRVKLQVVLDYIGNMPCDSEVTMPSWDAADLEFDHDPALSFREYDTHAGDFIPAQHDPKFLVLRGKFAHLEKTTGRKEGADKTVTTRGSDVGEAARTRDIADAAKVHEAAVLSKAGDFRGAALVLATRDPRKVKRDRKPKSKIKSRGFDKGHRPMRSRPSWT